ncbi:hypothetical protein [Micromonospora chersina]|uniref:hypothetical protein n=1 Tax=Micromonospora chersina TaxID=47854 RepID=UPI00371F6C74
MTCSAISASTMSAISAPTSVCGVWTFGSVFDMSQQFYGCGEVAERLLTACGSAVV